MTKKEILPFKPQQANKDISKIFNPKKSDLELAKEKSEKTRRSVFEE